MIDSRLNPNTTSGRATCRFRPGRGGARSAGPPRRDPRAGPRPRRRSTVPVARTRLPSMPSGSDATARRTREANRGRARLLSRQAVEGAPRPGTTATPWDGARVVAKAVGRVEGARAVGRAQRGGHRSGFGRAAKLAALAAVAVPLTTGCSVDEVLRFGWPVGVTPQATHMREFWTWSCIAALVVGVITWGAMFWAMIFHRKRAGDVGRAAAPDAVQPAHRDHLHGRPDDHRGGALRLHGAGAEQRRRRRIRRRTSRWTSPRSSGTGSSPTPTRARPTGAPVTTIGTADTIPLLVLPTNQSIQFTQRSNDVIHSFWVPEFLFKRDVFPMPEKNDQE